MSITTMHDGRVVLHHADCRDVLRGLPDNSIDSVVTDPPYALVSIQKRFGKPGSAPAKGNDAYMRASAGFMGANWDTGEVAFSDEFWAEVLRVLKPGGHVVAFSGTRTYHRMAVAIEDAGFEIRDQLGWLYGSGFPKSHDVSKGIDKRGPEGQAPFAEFAAHYEDRRKALGMTHAAICAAGEWFGKVNHGGSSVNWANGYGMPTTEQWVILQPLLELDEKWSERVARVQYEREVLGIKHGTKLAVAPGQNNDRGATALSVTAAGSEAARQWQGWGTALKPAWEPLCLARKPLCGTVAENVLQHGTGAINVDGCRVEGDLNAEGRWPANVIHDGSDEVVAAFPADGDKSASRFFYCAKASRADRDAGLEGFEKKDVLGYEVDPERPYASGKMNNSNIHQLTMAMTGKPPSPRANIHPTVKPTTLMQWLCRLVTPPGGVILDPFMGSGSTGKAAVLEGFQFVGCEREDEYMPIAVARIAWAIGASGAPQPEERPVVAKQQPAAANDNSAQSADLFSTLAGAA